MLCMTIDGNRLIRERSFYEEFSEKFGFPPECCCDRESWVDCMSCLDDAEMGMSSVCCQPGDVVILEIVNAGLLKLRSPAQYLTLLECVATVNCRRMESGESPLLILSFTV
ncbi:barstar family protein [Desulfolithobacter sp.]